MTFEAFQDQVAQAQASRAWQFEGQRDARLSLERISEVEAQMRVILPNDYRLFVSTYGAGDFAFTSVYSPDPDSLWSLWRAIEQFLGGRRDFLPFADNGCGDYLGFPVVSGRCEDRILWADHEQDYGTSGSQYVGFIDYMLKEGLRAEV